MQWPLIFVFFAVEYIGSQSVNLEAQICCSLLDLTGVRAICLLLGHNRNARPVRRLFIRWSCCPPMELVITSLASNAPIAKEPSRCPPVFLHWLLLYFQVLWPYLCVFFFFTYFWDKRAWFLFFLSYFCCLLLGIWRIFCLCARGFIFCIPCPSFFYM